jgi:DNA-binding NarL/FixJ family response regulator
MPIRIYILAPTPALRSGLRALLSGEEQVEVVGEAATLDELNEYAGLDVILLAGDGYSLDSLAAAVVEADPLPALLLLSEHPGAIYTLADLPLRAWGLLPPDAEEDELFAAVLALHEGLLAATPALLRPLLGEAPAQLADENEIIEELTARENEVLQLLAQGLPNKQIALELGISEHTVKFHISAIYAKLSVTNRTEAVRRALRLGLVVL